MIFRLYKQIFSVSVSVALLLLMICPPVWAFDNAAWTMTDYSKVLNTITNGPLQKTSQITLQMPRMVDDGASVPISIESNIPDTTSICIVGSKNPFPLIACLGFAKTADPFIETRIRLAQSGVVAVLVYARQKTYIHLQDIMIGEGGCAVPANANTVPVLKTPMIRLNHQGDKINLYLKVNHTMPRPKTPADYAKTNFLRTIRIATAKTDLVTATLGPSVSDNPYLAVRYNAALPAIDATWTNQQKQRRSVNIHSSGQVTQ